ncbi:Ribosomal RNA large subunit methyltransferase J domain protein [Candidatus Hepatincolaceae symbiont of Richtersius coronifer]
MLSYQHIYHAGNLADVHKHLIQSLVLAKINEKTSPITYMETHAGRGFYDLNSAFSNKTLEAQAGIIQLLKGELLKKTEIAPFLKIINLVHDNFGPDIYPGSPLIAASLLNVNSFNYLSYKFKRNQAGILDNASFFNEPPLNPVKPLFIQDYNSNQIYLMELHPQEYLTLKDNMKSYNIHIHKRDGYEGVLAISPPLNRRGLVLIDPSYEVKEEYFKMSDFLKKLYLKWPQTVIIIWYPILIGGLHTAMLEKIIKLNLPKVYKNEVRFKNNSQGILGSGVLLINTPYGLTETLETTKEVFQ